MIINSIISAPSDGIEPPSDTFDKLSYIQTNGSSSYVPLAISLSSYHIITAEFELLTIKDQPLFGGRAMSTTYREVAFCSTTNGGISYQCGANNVSANVSSITMTTDTRYIVKFENGKVTVNGTAYTGTAGTAFYTVNRPSMQLFHFYTNTSSDSRWWHGKLYRFDIDMVNNETGDVTPYRRYIPVKLKSNNSILLWDKVLGISWWTSNCTGG
jgi:hypothetical protein